MPKISVRCSGSKPGGHGLGELAVDPQTLECGGQAPQAEDPGAADWHGQAAARQPPALWPGRWLDTGPGAERWWVRPHVQEPLAGTYRTRYRPRRPGGRTGRGTRCAADHRGGHHAATGVPGRVLPLAATRDRSRGGAPARRRRAVDRLPVDNEGEVGQRLRPSTTTCPSTPPRPTQPAPPTASATQPRRARPSTSARTPPTPASAPGRRATAPFPLGAAEDRGRRQAGDAASMRASPYRGGAARGRWRRWPASGPGRRPRPASTARKATACRRVTGAGSRSRPHC
jgi:hypothetical protein